jgi:hypothetical protein
MNKIIDTNRPILDKQFSPRIYPENENNIFS